MHGPVQQHPHIGQRIGLSRRCGRLGQRTGEPLPRDVGPHHEVHLPGVPPRPGRVVPPEHTGRRHRPAQPDAVHHVRYPRRPGQQRHPGTRRLPPPPQAPAPRHDADPAPVPVQRLGRQLPRTRRRPGQADPPQQRRHMLGRQPRERHLGQELRRFGQRTQAERVAAQPPGQRLFERRGVQPLMRPRPQPGPQPRIRRARARRARNQRHSSDPGGSRPRPARPPGPVHRVDRGLQAAGQGAGAVGPAMLGVGQPPLEPGPRILPRFDRPVAKLVCHHPGRRLQLRPVLGQRPRRGPHHCRAARVRDDLARLQRQQRGVRDVAAFG